MTGVGLGPEAERTLCRATARGVERDVRIQQKRNVIAAEIEIVDDRSLRVVLVCSVLAENNTWNLVERLAQGEIANLIIELAFDHEIDRFGGAKAFFGPNGYVRSYKGHLELRIHILHHFRNPDVDMEAGRGRKEHQELVIGSHCDRLFDADLVGRSIQDLAAGDHSGRIA